MTSETKERIHEEVQKFKSAEFISRGEMALRHIEEADVELSRMASAKDEYINVDDILSLLRKARSLIEDLVYPFDNNPVVSDVEIFRYTSEGKSVRFVEE